MEIVQHIFYKFFPSKSFKVMANHIFFRPGIFVFVGELFDCPKQHYRGVFQINVANFRILFLG